VGTTPFSIADWDITLDEGVGLSFSVLHKLRAEALGQLTERLLKPWRERLVKPMRALPPLPKLASARRGLPLIGVIVADAHAATLARKAGADRIYLNETLTVDSTAASASAASPTRSSSRASAPAGSSVRPHTIYLPAIAHDDDLPVLTSGLGPQTPIVANQLAEITLAQQAGAPFEAGPSLGICNSDTLALLARAGATQAWLSPELVRADIEALSPTAPLLLALTIAGRQELMVTEHCLLMAKGPCNQNCDSCSRRRSEHLLEDRKGYRFPLRTDRFGRSHLYNAVPLDLVTAVPELLAIGISTFVVDATLMNAATLKEEVARARRALDLALTNGATLSKREGRTSGHLYRGVL
jgi:putative protease